MFFPGSNTQPITNAIMPVTKDDPDIMSTVCIFSFGKTCRGIGTDGDTGGMVGKGGEGCG